MTKISNAISIDVEDYFQVNAFAKNISVDDWDKFKCRVVNNTEKILDQFAEHNWIGTFFILGWVAERFPDLVAKIDKAGHEVASHGYSHQLIYSQSREVFKEETLRSKAVLENITGKKVRGYRAASYSITDRSLWAFDTLIEAGFEYDSSVFPVRHDVYGIKDFPKDPHIYKGSDSGTIVEFPISTCKLLGYELPVAGGGYFRLYPYRFTRYCLNKLNRENRSFVFYLHPWEVDPEQPRVDTNWKSRFRHYNNLNKCSDRLNSLLKDFRFTSVEQVLVEKGLLDKA
jgi:polysaccharide deacetylase family protein (PEP-CTERM system associated)